MSAKKMAFVLCLIYSTFHVLLDGLKLGAKVTVELSKKCVGDAAELVSGQLIGGSLLPHAVVQLAPAKAKYDVSLVANKDCTCFGFRAKKGDVVAMLTFEGRQSDAQKIALGQQVLLGRLVAHTVVFEAQAAEDERKDQVKSPAKDGDQQSPDPAAGQGTAATPVDTPEEPAAKPEEG
jgi:hypothetical protein